jgi:hypothetical protein
MIIQVKGAAALLITQPAHAALAGRIMTVWKDRNFDNHPRRESVLLAVSEHDNGWREVDAAPVLDPSNGRMLDFINVPAETRRAIWPRGVRRLDSDPWAAALVAQHALHVYRHYREDSDWKSFFSELESLRDQYVERAAEATGLDDLVADYFFVRMGDLLSLTFCNAWAEAPDELGFTIRCEQELLTVAPDPFEGSELALEVSARRLSNEKFGTTGDAARAFRSAAAFAYRGCVRGAPRA